MVEWAGRAPSIGRTRLRAALTAIAAPALFASAAVAVPATAATAAPGPLRPVIVTYDGTTGGTAAAAVTHAGGTVGRRLDLVNSFAATVPDAALPLLRRTAGVRAVTVDGKVRLKGEKWRATDSDQNSMYKIAQRAGVPGVWALTDPQGHRVTGKGVGVALIDSGVAPVKGLGDPARLVNGPDLSFESQAANLRYLDTFGHGTHMAGIIAGRDPEVAPGNETDPKYFVGMAPDATLVSLKVAAADGATDVSQVIAAIDWVVQHRNDPGLNIRVLNLSFGTDSTQDPRLDPLSMAVEAAWRKGIVVVVSAGNEGAGATRVSMPAANPYVIAVGAADPNGTDPRGDDVVASFSSRGNSTRHADLLAEGRSVISLRNPNSYVDVNFPSGLVSGDKDQRFFRGSGTSQAAAVVSGAAALLVQHRPALTPDQVKKLLTGTADAMPTADPIWAGAGELNVARAAAAPTPAYAQSWPAATGTGLLERSRGTSHVADPVTGQELTGERDVLGQTWTGGAWSQAALAGCTWSGGTWNSRTWSGATWTSTTWSSRTWSATTWSGSTWSSRTWSSTTWSGASWTGTGWTSRTWSSRTWSGASWTNSDWAGAKWQ